MIFAFLNAYQSPKPPKAISEQKEANDKNKPKDGMGLTTQVYGCEGIVGDMDDNARDNASRTSRRTPCRSDACAKNRR